MRHASFLIIVFVLSAVILLPFLLVIAIQLDYPNFFQMITRLFSEVYFNILPGLFFSTLALKYIDRLTAKGKKFAPVDALWIAITLTALILFVYAYTSSPESIFHTTQVLPMLGILSPDLFSFVLWNTLFVMITGGIVILDTRGRLGYDKTKSASLMTSLLIAITFALFLVKAPFFSDFEEFFVALRFSWLRNPGKTEYAPGLHYCPVPEDESKKVQGANAASNDGITFMTQVPHPPKVRDDIEIIGITNKTIEEVKGNWPLDWQIYANVARRFENAQNSLLLFDISFLDDKGVYGGNYCDVKFKCNPITDTPIRKQVDILKESFNTRKAKIFADYPMETTDEARSSISNYNRRMALLNAKMRLRHVKNGQYGIIWAKLPLPPVEAIARVANGIGYANVLKSEQGMNRWMPIVIRLPNEARASAADYNPDVDDFFYPGIDLVLAANYYGIDVRKDVEVDWLKGYVKLNHIPKRSYSRLNKETFEMEEFDIMAVPPSAGGERSITIPINRTGLMNINFRGGRFCFKHDEILEVSEMDPELAEHDFAGKISLVAMYYATGVGTAKDIHLSPYGDMAGIEHHAYALNTILNQDFAYDAPPWLNLLLLVVVAIIMGVYQPRVQTLLSFLLAIGIAIFFTLFTLFVSFDFYSYIHVFPTVILEQLLIFVGFIGLRVLTEEENVKFIRNTFSKFVSQDVVNELLTNPDAISLGGAKKEVSVFFSDVRGFTTISEALGPEDLVHLLNEYLSEMTELIIDYRGTIDKYMGDAIMAFWGAPAKNDDHAYYACVAAIAQYRALQELQKRWSERNIPVLDIGIGINTGPAVVGNMGSSRRMDYTLMGDTVNLGSRLEGITKQYSVKICISEYTYERVKDRIYARELDLVRVKGKLQPVRIYELMGLVNDADLINLKTSVQSATGTHKIDESE